MAKAIDLEQMLSRHRRLSKLRSTMTFTSDLALYPPLLQIDNMDFFLFSCLLRVGSDGREGETVNR